MVSIRRYPRSAALPDAPLYVYGLVDPVCNLIRYIGVADDPEKRLTRHLYGRKVGRTYKNSWLCKLWLDGLRPTIIIIDRVNMSCEDWEVIERFYISSYRAAGFPLTNGTAGGFGANGYIPTPDIRQKHSIATAKWAREHPDRIIKGAQHWSRLFPDRVARGDRNGARIHPERRPRGEQHGSYTHPERWARGERHGLYGKTGDAHPQGGDKNWQRLHPERVRRGEQVNGVILTREQAREIRVRYAGRIKGKKDTAPLLAKEYGVCENTIYQIIRGDTWKEASSTPSLDIPPCLMSAPEGDSAPITVSEPYHYNTARPMNVPFPHSIRDPRARRSNTAPATDERVIPADFTHPITELYQSSSPDAFSALYQISTP